MEIMKITLPTSWDDCSMDWNDPDPGCANYVLALREALVERAIAVNRSIGSNVFTVMPLRPWTYDIASTLRGMVYELAPYFVNIKFDDYKDDLSDFPKMWTLGELVTEDCNIAETPGRGATSLAWKTWFKSMQTVINKLTCIQFSGITGTVLSRSGSTHDPPFSKSINTAMENAMKNDPSRSDFSSFPQQFYAWSGNTEYRYDKDTGERGYCGYAQSRSILIKKAQKPHPTAECDLIFKYCVTKPTTPVGYSSELQHSIFSTGSTGIKEGVETIVTHWSSNQEFDITLGNADDIPKNSTVPTTYWGNDTTIRRSSKTGYEGIVYCILDFGVKNGFKFQ